MASAIREVHCAWSLSLTIGAVLASTVLGCRREPPPASGETEQPTPIVRGDVIPRVPVAPPPASHPVFNVRAAPCPDGSVVIANPLSCVVTRIRRERALWSWSAPACSAVLELAVAADSSIYVRTNDRVVALSADGHEVWKMTLAETIPAELAHPTTTLDSLLVLATTPTTVSAYSPRGTPAWEFRVPHEEFLTASPSSSRTEGVTLVSTSAVYFVGADGGLRSRTKVP